MTSTKTGIPGSNVSGEIQRASSRSDETIVPSPGSILDESKEEKSPESESVHGVTAEKIDDYPDGGLRAWLVLFGAMCATFSTFGYVNAWGVFQSYYEETLLRDSTPSAIAWIGSIQYSLVFLPALIVGRLFDIGHFRILSLGAGIVLVVATFLTAECTEYWQFLLCQGIAIGLASGAVFGPTVAVIAHWFNRRRGFALGMNAVGSSVGGTIFPIAARELILRVGFPWTMRIIGFILLFTLGLANLTLKRRLAPVHSTGGYLNLRAFKSAPYTIYCISSFFVFLGLYTVLTFVDVSATSMGISPSFSFYLVSIANASGGFGRIFCGVISDRFGPMNVMIPFTALAAVLTYAWPFAKSEAALIVVDILYGFFSGAYTALLSKPIMEFGDTEDVGRRVGMFMSILALGALAGPPISGAINTATGGFAAVGYYAGSAILVGVGLMGISRHLALGRIMGRF